MENTENNSGKKTILMEALQFIIVFAGMTVALFVILKLFMG